MHRNCINFSWKLSLVVFLLCFVTITFLCSVKVLHWVFYFSCIFTVERIKDCIQSRHTHLIENLEPNGHIDFLFQEQVFSPEEYEELTCREQSKFTKVRELMKKLFTKPADRWVYKFVESLKRDSAVENLAAEFQNVD